ncbi:MAG: hypothetical protein ACLUIR_02785 [Faecalibacterium prausnitzii]
MPGSAPLSFVLMLVRGCTANGSTAAAQPAASAASSPSSPTPASGRPSPRTGRRQLRAVFLCILLLTLGGSAFTLLLGPDLQALLTALAG